MTDKPTTGNEDLDLLIKCLGMTTSDNDNIALVSIRKANSILEKKGFEWDALLRGRVKVVADPFAQPAVNGGTPPQQPVTQSSRPAMRTGRPMAAPQPTPQPPPAQPAAAGASRPFQHVRYS